MLDLVDDLVFGFLVELLDEGVHSLHFLDPGSVLLSRLLDPQFDFILLQLILVVSNHSFLLISNVFLLLDGKLIFCLSINILDSLVSVTSDEGYHRL